MHIMYMLGILTFIFFAALILMCFFREKLKHPLVNPLFIFVNTIFFFYGTSPCLSTAARILNS